MDAERLKALRAALVGMGERMTIIDRYEPGLGPVVPRALLLELIDAVLVQGSTPHPRTPGELAVCDCCGEKLGTRYELELCRVCEINYGGGRCHHHQRDVPPSGVSEGNKP